MKRDDWMLLTLTFLTGAAIGMYMYVAVWKPVYFPEDLGNEEAEASDWSIVGERRQGGATEASFRLLSDGSYSYIAIDDLSGEPEARKEGSIKKTLVKELMVSEDEIASYEEETECLASDKVEYEYRFTIDNYTYLLDTCNTELGHDTELSLLLKKAWHQMEGSVDGTATPSEWLTNWLNERIGANKNN
ncbi:hypothetical protein A2837_01080 [Candidatus Kaiserbacteria bacterium RIFCSPHIGHO2_01_FULL_46_22]|uniref:Uncharacterized protein n=1 Tax=Candidatus Kaiserbacteria bacterium RIFCSPHIGHO2_01_FULL_46_22 TaxID=1798475 RepID=A0A1F6BY03_9BACT|nr:MAG: hypothetical protein A2837_01080 [Candidatus Kaiserbacteria bacterium RIFCSPHIGHO2_01_FULL_46_22]